MALAMTPTRLPVIAWLLVLSFDPGHLALHFVATCRTLRDGCCSATALPRLVVARKWLASAFRSLSGMMLSPTEDGVLCDLVTELRRAELAVGRREEQLRGRLGGLGGNTATADVLPDEFDAVFLHLLVLLTDARRYPSTAAPYIAALHLRQLTSVAGGVGGELMRSLEASRAAVPQQELFRARKAVICALAALGGAEAPHIVRCFRELKSEDCSVQIAVLEALSKMGCSPDMVRGLDIALVVGDSSEDVRRAAMELFEQVAPSDDIVTVLSRELYSDKVVALAALRALACLGQSRISSAALRTKVIIEIVVWLGPTCHRQDRKMHSAVAHTLSRLRPFSADAVLSLKEMLDTGLDVHAFRSVSDALDILQNTPLDVGVDGRRSVSDFNRNLIAQTAS